MPIFGREVDSEETSRYDSFSRFVFLSQPKELPIFCSYDKVSAIKARTLICHGNQDTRVSREHSEVLYRKLRNATVPYYVNTWYVLIFSLFLLLLVIREFSKKFKLGFISRSFSTTNCLWMHCGLNN